MFFCYQGIGETNGRRPTNGDLAGFWDMVMIQVCTASKINVGKDCYKRLSLFWQFLKKYIPKNVGTSYHEILNKLVIETQVPPPMVCRRF